MITLKKISFKRATACVSFRKKGKTKEPTQSDQHNPLELLKDFGRNRIKKRFSAPTSEIIFKCPHGDRRGCSAVNALANLMHYFELSIKREKKVKISTGFQQERNLLQSEQRGSCAKHGSSSSPLSGKQLNGQIGQYA